VAAGVLSLKSGAAIASAAIVASVVGVALALAGKSGAVVMTWRGAGGLSAAAYGCRATYVDQANRNSWCNRRHSRLAWRRGVC